MEVESAKLGDLLLQASLLSDDDEDEDYNLSGESDSESHGSYVNEDYVEYESIEIRKPTDVPTLFSYFTMSISALLLLCVLAIAITAGVKGLLQALSLVLRLARWLWSWKYEVLLYTSFTHFARYARLDARNRPSTRRRWFVESTYAIVFMAFAYGYYPSKFKITDILNAALFRGTRQTYFVHVWIINEGVDACVGGFASSWRILSSIFHHMHEGFGSYTDKSCVLLMSVLRLSSFAAKYLMWWNYLVETGQNFLLILFGMLSALQICSTGMTLLTKYCHGKLSQGHTFTTILDKASRRHIFKAKTCAICLDSFREPMYLKVCNHVFCNHCILQHLGACRYEDVSCYLSECGFQLLGQVLRRWLHGVSISESEFSVSSGSSLPSSFQCPLCRAHILKPLFKATTIEPGFQRLKSF